MHSLFFPTGNLPGPEINETTAASRSKRYKAILTNKPQINLTRLAERSSLASLTLDCGLEGKIVVLKGLWVTYRRSALKQNRLAEFVETCLPLSTLTKPKSFYE